MMEFVTQVMSKTYGIFYIVFININTVNEDRTTRWELLKITF